MEPSVRTARHRRTASDKGAEPALIVEEETLFVSKTIVAGKETVRANEKREVLQVRKFASEPAYIRMSQGITRNLGNYESLRIDVGVTLPCYPEEVDSIVPQLGQKVAAYLENEIREYDIAMSGD
jgi:hypothetical protein